MTVTSDAEQPKFSTLRQLFFPVQKSELKKVFWVSLFFTFVLFVYNLTKGFKYVFIQKYAVCGGTELIPSIKLFFVFPAIILSLCIFEILIDKFGRRRTFNIIVSTFVIFFILFAFVLFPIRDVIHPSAETVSQLRNSLPSFCYYIIPCFTNWSFTLYYVFTEIWGGLVIPVLFWQFANMITLQSEAGRLYGMYVALGHIGTISAGFLVSQMSSSQSGLLEKNITKLMIIAALMVCAMILIYNHVSKIFSKDISLAETNRYQKKENKNIFTSSFEGIKIVFKNSYVRNIVFMLLGYYILSDLTEIVWLNFMNQHLSKPELSQKMGDLASSLGIITIIFSFVASFIMQKFRWKTAALLTPFILIFTGGTLVLLCFFRNIGLGVLQNNSMIKIIVTIGLFAVASIKSAKFSIFDITKNIAYRPLDEETKLKGQAAAETLGSKLGKSSSSGVQYALTNLISVGSKIGDHLHIIIIIYSILTFGWIKSVFNLGKNYEAKIKDSVKFEETKEEENLEVQAVHSS